MTTLRSVPAERPTVEGSKLGLWCMAASVALTCGLAVWLAHLVFTSVPNVPFWDEWDLTPIIARAHLGTLEFRDLWVPHNEHRMLFPQLLVVILDHFGGWSQVRECILSVAFALVGLAVYANVIRSRFSDVTAATLLVGAAILTFSPAQWENWLWGFQTAWLLINCSLFATIWFLARPTLRPLDVLGAMAAATVGAFSSAFGLCILIAGGVAIIARDDGHLRAFRDWIVFSGLIAFAYLFHFSFTSGANSEHPSPARIVHFAIAFAGSGVARFAGQGGATVAGVIALAALVAAFAAIARSGRSALAAGAPFLGIVAFGLATALMTAAGRAHFGMEGAVTSRYYTTAITVWLGLLPLVALALHGPIRWPRFVLPAVVIVLGIAFAGGALACFADGLQGLEARRQVLLDGLFAARHFERAPDAEFEEIYPNAERPRAMMRMLSALHDGPHADARSSGAVVISPYPAYGSLERLTIGERNAVGHDIAASSGDRLTVAGWAADPVLADPGRTVLLLVDGAIHRATARTGLSRPDVAAATREPRGLLTGFEIVSPLAGLPAGAHSVQVCVLADIGESCYPLGTPATFHIVARRSPGIR